MNSITEKSILDNLTPKEFADKFFGPEDERKITCIHCKKIWYEMHYKDGVCHSCQQKGLPGRTQLENKLKRTGMINFVVYIIITLIVIYLLTL